MVAWIAIGAALVVFGPKAAALARQRDYGGLAIMALALVGIPLVGWVVAY